MQVPIFLADVNPQFLQNIAGQANAHLMYSMIVTEFLVCPIAEPFDVKQKRLESLVRTVLSPVNPANLQCILGNINRLYMRTTVDQDSIDSAMKDTMLSANINCMISFDQALTAGLGHILKNYPTETLQHLVDFVLFSKNLHDNTPFFSGETFKEMSQKENCDFKGLSRRVQRFLEDIIRGRTMSSHAEGLGAAPHIKYRPR
ncbi:MAG: hypothetical protein V4490_08670 [Pseudomonadota bacterium]